jgi:hypothetical protein
LFHTRSAAILLAVVVAILLLLLWRVSLCKYSLAGFQVKRDTVTIRAHLVVSGVGLRWGVVVAVGGGMALLRIAVVVSLSWAAR